MGARLGADLGELAANAQVKKCAHVPEALEVAFEEAEVECSLVAPE